MGLTNIGVSGYFRKTKSGKVVRVDRYRQTRDLADLLAQVDAFRPKVAAQSGTFPNNRAIPITPASQKGLNATYAAQIKAAKQKTKATKQNLQKAAEQLTKAAKEEQAAANPVGPKTAVKKPTAPTVGKSKPKAKGAFTHPSGSKHEIPEGGSVRQHKASKDSFLILDADGEPATFVNKNGKAQKPPAHAIKAKDTNYKPYGLGDSGDASEAPDGAGKPPSAPAEPEPASGTKAKPDGLKKIREANEALAKAETGIASPEELKKRVAARPHGWYRALAPETHPRFSSVPAAPFTGTAPLGEKHPSDYDHAQPDPPDFMPDAPWPSQKERDAMVIWANGEHKINANLRAGEPLPWIEKNTLEALTSYAKKARTSKDHTFVRMIEGVDIPEEGEEWSPDVVQATEAVTADESNYSRVKQAGQAFLEIEAPAGSSVIPGNFVQGFGGKEAENEYLLPPGTKFEVVSKSMEDVPESPGDQYLAVKLRIVPDAAPAKDDKKWRSEKIRRKLEDVKPAAAKLRKEFEDLNPGAELHFGGSFRREAPTVGDLDMIIVTENGTLKDVKLPGSFKAQRGTDKASFGDMELDDGTDLHVDIWATTPKERGAFLWYVTGPKELNVAMRAEALKQGRHLMSTGLTDDTKTKQLDDGTEENVAEMLGEKWKKLLDPKERQKWTADKSEPIQKFTVMSSDGKTAYTVTKQGNKLKDDCPAGKFGKPCKHKKQVQAQLDAADPEQSPQELKESESDLKAAAKEPEPKPEAGADKPAKKLLHNLSVDYFAPSSASKDDVLAHVLTTLPEGIKTGKSSAAKMPGGVVSIRVNVTADDAEVEQIKTALKNATGQFAPSALKIARPKPKAAAKPSDSSQGGVSADQPSTDAVEAPEEPKMASPAETGFADPIPGPATTPQGVKTYLHPGGSRIDVMPDGTMVAYDKNGKPGKKTSATPEKLAAGHGQWKEGEAPEPSPAELLMSPEDFVAQSKSGGPLGMTPKEWKDTARNWLENATDADLYSARNKLESAAFVSAGKPSGAAAKKQLTAVKKELNRRTKAEIAKMEALDAGWKPIELDNPDISTEEMNSQAAKELTPEVLDSPLFNDEAPLPLPTKPEEVVLGSEEPEMKSVAAPKGSKYAAPMVFNEAPVSDVPKYIADDDYHFQQKVDGIRGQLVVEPGKKPWFRSKSGEQLKSGSAEKITGPLLQKMKTTEGGPAFTLDGELLDGHWYVFDMQIDGQNDTPWEERMKMAEAMVENLRQSGLTEIRPLPVARTPEEKQQLFDTLFENGGEGVMMKRKDAKYQFGKRVNDILKAKFTSTLDVVVMEKGLGGKDNAEIGVYKDGKLRSVGKVSLLGKEKTGAINIGDVLEVEYLWANPETLKVTQPRIKKKRPDKPPEDATSDQLRMVNKDVLDAQSFEGVKKSLETPPTAVDEDDPLVSSAPLTQVEFQALSRQFWEDNPDLDEDEDAQDIYNAIADYTAMDYGEINLAARGLSNNKTAKAQVKLLDRAMEFAPKLQQPTMLYRGTRLTEAPEVGKTLKSKGFVSTSSDSAVAAKFATSDDAYTLKILAPAGTTVLPAGGTGGESELVLPRNSPLKVLSVDEQTREVTVSLPEAETPPPMEWSAKKAEAAANDLREYFKDDASAFSNTLDKADKEGPRYYRGSGYLPINMILRGQDIGAYYPEAQQAAKLTDLAKSWIEALDNVFAKPNLPRTSAPTLAWRGTGTSVFTDFDPKELYVPGELVIDPGFTSTSLDRGEAEGFKEGEEWMIEVRIPEGTGFLHGDSQEAEIILNRGTAFRVLSRDDDAHEIVLEVQK